MTDPKPANTANVPPSPPAQDDWSSEDREPDETTPAGRLWYIDLPPKTQAALRLTRL
jgi:hypothetical protein